MRNRLEGEASVGHEPGLPSSKEEAPSSCVSNVMTSREGDLGGLGLTQGRFNHVSTAHQLLLPRGGLGVIMSEHSHRFDDVPQWFMSLQAAGAAARGGCMENATTQLDSIIRSIQKEKEIKKQQGEISIKIRLELLDG